MAASRFPAWVRRGGATARRFVDWLGADLNRAPSYVQAIFAEAEHRSETLLAYLRLGVFTILLLLLRVFDFFGNHRVAILSIAIYGVATGGSILFAWRRFYRPWLPWVFITLDVALVVDFVAMLTEHEGFSAAAAFSTPGGIMIFLIMAHAAVRYRPALVLYAAGLFLAARIGFDITLTANAEPIGSEWTAKQEWAQIVVTLLTAATLFATALRTRRLLLTAIKDAYLRTSLARFVPSTLVEELADRGDAAGTCRQQQVAVLFADLRGFTAASERMPPPAVLDFLNEYRRRMSIAIAAHGGTVDKFIGDEIMVVFGIPRPWAGDARDAVSCGLAMLEAVASWNKERIAAGMDAVCLGIGAHYGQVIVGAIGDEERLEYTVIGDTVNTAQRIERLCAEQDVPLLVSAALLRRAGPMRIMWESVSVQKVRGREQLVELFAPIPRGRPARKRS